MVSGISPSGMSSAAALNLLQTLKTVAGENESFMAAASPSVSPSSDGRVSSDTMFAILASTASAKGHAVTSSTTTAQPGTAQTAANGVQSTVAASQPVATTSAGSGTASASPADATAADLNAVLDEARSMTSQQINDAMYSGQGIPAIVMEKDGSLGAGTDTLGETMGGLADFMTTLNSSIEGLRTGGNVAAAAIAPDQRAVFADQQQADLDRLQNIYSGLTAAIANHTASFGNPLDVPSLGFGNTYHYTADANGMPASLEGGQTASNNGPSDGKNHTIFGMGGSFIYATW